ncbi:hypothetical protein [Streptomyces sp. NPDC048172]|uniref:hypothetical protein n=1 Tax=Streptomyces sp. NPDC048172 TaxID=3365505 RepID=UPI0037137DBE
MTGPKHQAAPEIRGPRIAMLQRHAPPPYVLTMRTASTAVERLLGAEARRASPREGNRDHGGAR